MKVQFTEPWPPGSTFGGNIKRSSNKRWFANTNPKTDYVVLTPGENIVEITAGAYSLKDAARRIVENCEAGIRKLEGLKAAAVEDFELDTAEGETSGVTDAMPRQAEGGN